MELKRDYYEILGVSRTAANAEIRRAFDKLIGTFRSIGKPLDINEVEEIRAIATAYRVLSDADKRDRYDRFGYASINDRDNKLASGGPDKLDRLLDWIRSRRE
jgi:molecular chaperone DnaJ